MVASNKDPAFLMKKAAQKIAALQTQITQDQAKQHEPIAIIGMGCRVPQAEGPEAFWQLLCDGVDAITEVPDGRWDIAAHYDADQSVPGKMYTKAGGFIDHLDTFDPLFFNMAPREAISLDPQQRTLLEVTWEALEHAAIATPPAETGVFVSTGSMEYLQYIIQQGFAEIDTYFSSGNSANTASGRLSYLLGLHGPCMTLDTACSSSLVAVHLACQNLRQNKCTMALAGGSNRIVMPTEHISFCKGEMLSPDGRCKTFDAAGNGFVRAEGCGIVVLKRLSDAQADGDRILAVVQGSAINHDGRTSGLTVPHGPAQEAVIQDALADGRLTPQQVGYIEAHGTGTKLGDPIEVEALGNVFGQREQPLVIGSVKSAIGHLEAAAGIAGLMKAVLAIQHSAIPPNLHFNEPNPFIDWDNLPVQVPTTLQDWSAEERVAGVSSFGFSGTNAHIVLAQAPTENVPPAPHQPTATAEAAPQLLTLSAKTPGALQDLAQRYADHLAAHPAINLTDLCYTANTGRQHFQHRLALLAESSNHLLTQLTQDNITGHRIELEKRPKIAFLFTGQGAQYTEMGYGLYKTQPIFQEALDQCDALLRPHLKQSILSVLYTAEHAELIHQTTYTQPALFAFEYALVKLWQAWGIHPDIMIGHSVGEVVAACVAGVFSLEDGLKLIAARSNLMGAVPSDGGMVALQCDEAQARAAIIDYAAEVSIAAVNGPQSIVISGKQSLLESIVEQLTAEGIKAKVLQVSHAFHSPLMEPMLEAFREVAESITYHSAQVSLISNVTGRVAGNEVSTPDYWVRHVREAVRFADGMQTIPAQGSTILLEIGPQTTLLGMARLVIESATQEAHFSYLPSLRQHQPDAQQILRTLADLYMHGMMIDWAALYPQAGQKIALPTYPFQRERYWIDASAATDAVSCQKEVHHTALPLINRVIKSPLLKEVIGETVLSVERFPFLDDHRVFGEVVSPGSCQLSIVLQAIQQVFPQSLCQLVDVNLPQPLVLTEDTGRLVQVVFTPETGIDADTTAMVFRLISLSVDGVAEESAQTHMLGQVRFPGVVTPTNKLSLANLRERCDEKISKESYYHYEKERQLDTGAHFQWLTDIWRGEGEALGRLVCPGLIAGQQDAAFYPTLIDCCLQVATSLLFGKSSETWLPFSFSSVQFLAAMSGKEWWCYAQEVDVHCWNIQLCDVAGNILLKIDGYAEKQAVSDNLMSQQWRQWLYDIHWQPLPLLNTEKTALPSIQDEQSVWLIFADSMGIGQAIAKFLQHQGKQPVLVFPDYYDVDKLDGIYSIAPDSPTDYQRLLADHANIQHVIYLWGIEQVEHQLDQAVYPLCNTFLYLTQALLNRASLPDFLWVVTQGAQAIAPDETLEGLAQVPLWGICKVLAIEHTELHCMLVDLEPMLDVDSVAQKLCAEAINASASSSEIEHQLVLRQDQRYAARLVRRQLAVSDSSTVKIHPEGSYLITGGLGGLGLKLTEWLVDQGAGHVILLSRRQPEEAIAAQLATLKPADTEVQVMQADVTDWDQMVEVFARINTHNCPVRGVFHAAGVVDDSSLLHLTSEQLATVLAPKIQGSWYLHLLTEKMTLDFYVMFSSSASMLGHRGQANYAAGNIFLDGLAHYRRARQLPALSINWGTWDEVGMAAKLGLLDTLGKQNETAIPVQTGLTILGDLLGETTAQIGVIPLNLPSFLSSGVGNRSFYEKFAKFFPSDDIVQPEEEKIYDVLAQASEDEREKLLRTYVCEQISAILGVDIAVLLTEKNMGFAALGMDSLTSVELRNNLQQAFSCSLPVTFAFDYPTTEAVTAYLMDTLFKPISSAISDKISIDPNMQDDVNIKKKNKEMSGIASADEQHQSVAKQYMPKSLSSLLNELSEKL